MSRKRDVVRTLLRNGSCETHKNYDKTVQHPFEPRRQEIKCKPELSESLEKIADSGDYSTEFGKNFQFSAVFQL